MKNNKESILLDFLPETVMVDEKHYEIDSNFRTGIIFEKILNDDELDNREIVEASLSLFYKDEIPDDKKEALEAILDFYSCGTRDSREKKAHRANSVNQPRIYDYDFDADYIFAAFLSQYGIDLNEIEYMHWWKFQALFKGLENRNKIVEIMGYRATDLGQIKDKKEKARMARLKAIYAIPENLSFEDKVARAGAAFGGMI